eukprot:CAMPEP_0184754334 /NCGR_PEP_ID=MMETSP0315-20130426/44569_1 /TAXON_ID=101924 /ORGANISM="Rhodosorus marinus, Strain UTEX LB 2760" /LENGTH=454 /DNA_ID=CAMNT_0027233751 /DNA_START=50 /DNA_END=1414 /DNA_ORIENTATION=-
MTSETTRSRLKKMSCYTAVGPELSSENIKRRIQACENFLSSNTCRRLIRAKMTRSLVDGPLVPEEWMRAFCDGTLEDAQALSRGLMPSWSPLSLREFVEEAKSLAISRDPVMSSDTHSLPNDMRIGLTAKKEHEVVRLSTAVADLAERVNSKKVVDIGSGKGYLGQVLALHHGLDVVGLEAQSLHNASSQMRTERVRALKRSRGKGTITSLTYEITSLTYEINTADEVNAELKKECRDAVIVALHACGDLTPTAMQLFAKTDASALVLLGCCYHRITADCFPMGPTLCERSSVIQPMLDGELGCHALEEWSEREPWRLRSHGYRALLEEILEERGVEKSIQLGRLKIRYKPTDLFEDYARRVLSRLPDLKTSPSDEDFISRSERSQRVVPSSACVYALRLLIAAVIESVIVLDRLEFLQDRVGRENSSVKAIFDPVCSPRNLGLFATKPGGPPA